MKLLDSIEINHGNKLKKIELLEGNLSRIPNTDAIDLLIVSAFPNDYSPTQTSLIGALANVGLSVDLLSKDKLVDLRAFSSCWLSKKIDNTSCNFSQLLCFEPKYTGSAPELVGDIFRSLVPFCDGKSIKSVAMPIIATGDQEENVNQMINILVDTSIHWLHEGKLPLDLIKIVILEESEDISDAVIEFSKVKKDFYSANKNNPDQKQYDVFISYSHKNALEANDLLNKIKFTRPNLRVFIDRLELNTGFAWQNNLFEALENSKTVICLYSPEYLQSKVCIDEFNVALLMHRENEKSNVLFPILLYSADLPKYMQLIQFEDIREGDLERMNLTVRNFLNLHFPLSISD